MLTEDKATAGQSGQAISDVVDAVRIEAAITGQAR
jgi:hypothetical protein